MAVGVLVGREGRVGRGVLVGVGVHSGCTMRVGPDVGVGSGAAGTGLRIDIITTPASPPITIRSKIARTAKTTFCLRLKDFIVDLDVFRVGLLPCLTNSYSMILQG